jgi:sugar phosphate isomerase/epimerase
MIELSKLKLAAYLEEADDDPIKACRKVADLGINAVCLRRVWSTNVCSLNGQAAAILKEALEANNLKVALLCSNIGNVPVTSISTEIEHIDRAIFICQYLDCKILRFSLGKAVKNDRAIDDTEKWMKIVSDMTMKSDIKPVFELNHSYNINTPAGFASALQKFPRWSAIYDPAALIAHRNIDPFVKYWSLLKNRISHIDLHDYKIGNSARPPGHGDGKLDLVISDALSSKYCGWYCLEPGLGRKFGDKITREKTFEYALQCLTALLGRIDIGSVDTSTGTPWYKNQK